MRVTHRVLYSDNSTAGFIVESQQYFEYRDVLENIKAFDNVYSTKDGVIKSNKGKLKTISKEEYNKSIYDRLVNECPLVRDVQCKLEDWGHKTDKSILMLNGARQTGKTTELSKFAYKHFEDVIYINLGYEQVRNEFISIVIHSNNKFMGMYNYCTEVIKQKRFIDSQNTIIIIDEIQESPEVFNSLRSLKSELKCKIAITGSYLARVLNKDFFQPAGDTYEVELNPLSFREICRALGKEDILNNISALGESSSKDYKELTQVFYLYTSIGGYPAVVREYIKYKNKDKCTQLIKNIVSRFTDESAHYFTDDRCRLVFDNVYKAAVLVQAREKKGTDNKLTEIATDFVKSGSKTPVSRQEVNQALAWLSYNGILGYCDMYNNGNPFDLLTERRTYFRDCGILRYIIGTTAIPEEASKGLIAETFVYNELYQLYKEIPKKVKGDKPCCSVKGAYELDFMLIDLVDKKYGIEVKSNKASNPKSLSYYLQYKLIDDGIIAEVTKGGHGSKWKTIPIYLVGEKFPYNK